MVNVKLPQGEALFGVFDGHGGKEVAEYCKRQVVQSFVIQDKYATKDYEDALRECFLNLDALLESEEGLS